MSTYKMQGTYFWRGIEHQQEGLFEVDKNGNISGQIIDPDSSHPEREVEGKITQLDDRVVLEFVKKSDGTLYADIFYNLTKSGGKQIDGEYQGVWSVKEEIIRLGRGYKAGIGEVALVLPDNERENKAYLKLISKN